MIEYNVWLEGVTSICKLVANEEAIKKAWLERDNKITSIMGYDELYEQIFDDLDSNSYENLLPSMQQISNDQRLSISNFLSSLRELDKIIEQDERAKEPKILLNSVEWETVREAAVNVDQKFECSEEQKILE